MRRPGEVVHADCRATAQQWHDVALDVDAQPQDGDRAELGERLGRLRNRAGGPLECADHLP